jgi:hypothetical protein
MKTNCGARPFLRAILALIADPSAIFALSPVRTFGG